MKTPEKIYACFTQLRGRTVLAKQGYTHTPGAIEYIRADLGGWHACADELPPLDEPVWLFEDGRITIGERWVSEDTDGYLWAEVRDVPRWMRDHWESSYAEMEDLHPTLWMRLPEPPEGAK